MSSQVRPTQAVILAGGKGTRLLPLTKTKPKPMLIFHQKPFLEYLILQLKEQGFTHILLLLGYLPKIIMDYFGDGNKLNIKITYAVSEVEYDTGTRLRLAKEKIDSVFMLLYCDNYVPFKFDALWKVFCKNNADAIITIYSNKDKYTKDNVLVADDGCVLTYDKSRTTQGLSGVDIGYMIFKKSILDLIPANNTSFEQVIYPYLVKQHKLYAYVTHHRYYSVGDHARLKNTEVFLAHDPTILLDRDGVLNKKMPKGEYVRTWNEWQWLPKAKEALALFNKAGFRIIVITNQAGIARGFMSRSDLKHIHKNMRLEAKQAGGDIAAVYYCPHGWNTNCFCRKPAPGMFFTAQKDYHLDLSRLIYVGDDERDQMAAEAAGLGFIRVSASYTLYEVAQSLINSVPTENSRVKNNRYDYNKGENVGVFTADSKS